MSLAYTGATTTSAPVAVPPAQATRAGTSAPAPSKPGKLPREQDPRNPNFRLAALLDEEDGETRVPDLGQRLEHDVDD